MREVNKAKELCIKLTKNRIVRLAVFLLGVTATGLSVFAYGVKKTVDSVDRIICTNVLDGGRKPSSYIQLTKRIHVPCMVIEEGGGEYGVTEGWDWWRVRWNQRKRLFIWRLLEMANSDTCRKTRMRAVDTLLSYNLSDSEMGTVAQQSSAETAASIARCRAAQDKMFLKPTPPQLTEKELEEKMRDLLIELSKKQRHDCLKYFVSKAFPDYKTISSYFFMAFETGEMMKQVLKLSQDNLILSCLEALVHHCSIRNFAGDLVAVGGLSVLASCYCLRKDQPQVCLLLSKLILSVSLDQQHLQDLHRTGWLGILSSWSRGNDARLGALSCCALSNLDSICHCEPVFGQELYMLHPRVRSTGQLSTDVVLLHGLLGGLFFTWRQRSRKKRHFSLYRITSNLENGLNEEKDACVDEKNCNCDEDEKGDKQPIGSDYEIVLSDLPVRATPNCTLQNLSLSWEEAVSLGLLGRSDQVTSSWPMDWLAMDCQHLRLVGVNYDTRLSTWLPRCPLKEQSLDRSISAQSDALLCQLTKADVGSRPLVWIAHSMGGLLLKHILIKASRSNKEKEYALVKNTRAIVFLSTPHRGSPLASLSDTSRFLLQIPGYVSELRMNSPELLKLHADFLRCLEKHPIQVTTFLETKNTKITSLNIEIQCVPPSLSNPQTGEIYEIPLGHMDICKPDSKLSFIYQKILNIIKNVSQNSMEDKPLKSG